MSLPISRAEREAVLRSHGAGDSAVEELLVYSESGFDADAVSAHREYPLPDEPFVDAWAGYLEEVKTEGAAVVLRRHLVQLCFPIRSGVSETEEYRAATRRGIRPVDDSNGIRFDDEAGLEIILHPTPAGRLPLVITRARSDFETLIRALSHRNEPAPVPPSMGACIIGGYNNWSRIAASPVPLAELVPHKELYQDRFVILSHGPYSATPASSLGVDGDWDHTSLLIRMEHECAHYFTKRIFGSMRNSLIDELIADYTGIVAARGRFEREWLLRFMGVEHPLEWRPSGRLGNYRGEPPLSDGAFVVLQSMVRAAARTLDRFDALVRDGAATRARSLNETAAAITAMAGEGLERLASRGSETALYAAFRQRTGHDRTAGKPLPDSRRATSGAARA